MYTDRQSGGGCVAGPSLQIFDLARKMDMEDGRTDMNGEEIRAVRRFPEQAVLYRQQPSPPSSSPLLSSLSSFQQCDYDEVNKNIRSAGVRPMTDEAKGG